MVCFVISPFDQIYYAPGPYLADIIAIGIKIDSLMIRFADQIAIPIPIPISIAIQRNVTMSNAHGSGDDPTAQNINPRPICGGGFKNLVGSR